MYEVYRTDAVRVARSTWYRCVLLNNRVTVRCCAGWRIAMFVLLAFAEEGSLHLLVFSFAPLDSNDAATSPS